MTDIFTDQLQTDLITERYHGIYFALDVRGPAIDAQARLDSELRRHCKDPSGGAPPLTRTLRRRSGRSGLLGSLRRGVPVFVFCVGFVASALASLCPGGSWEVVASGPLASALRWVGG